MTRPPRRSPLFPYTPLSRPLNEHRHFGRAALACHITQPALSNALRALEEEFGTVIVRRGRSFAGFTPEGDQVLATALDRKSTRLNSSHLVISYAVFCLKNKK